MKDIFPVWSLVFSLIESMIIVIVALILAYDFYLAKDGILRVLMIWLFLSLAFVYLFGIVIIAGQSHGYWQYLSLGDFRWITALPLTVVMIRFLYYRFFEMRKK